MVERFDHIMQKLPYSDPFLFVDEILEIGEGTIKGTYTFPADSYFYEGHFKEMPITPGVILTECMAQIGLVSLGIHLLGDSIGENAQVAMTSTAIDFYVPVLPGEQVTVFSKQEYFRFHKLKCKVEMRNASGKLVCRGTISGMLKGSDEE